MNDRPTRRGLELTSLGLGAAQFGNLYRETTDEESRAAVDRAWELGLRSFDTAPHYGLGLSERRLGRALAGRPRDEYVVSTKVGRLLDPSPATAGEWDDEGFRVPADHRRRWDFSRDGVRRSLDDSLGRLGLDRVDIAYLHDPDDHWDEASTTGIQALLELREQGVVRAIGVGMNQSAMPAEFVRRFDIDLVMLAGRFTLLEQGALADLLPLAVERGVDVVAVGVYNSGLLSTERVSDDAKYDYDDAPPALVERAREIARVCAEHGATLPQAAVQYPLRHPAVASVTLGMRTAGHVEEAVERLRAPLPDDLWTALAERGLAIDPAPRGHA